MTCSLEECFLKLNNALNILGSKECSGASVTTRLTKPESSLSVSPVFASDVRATYEGRSFDFQTSPVLPMRQKFNVPDHMNHEVNCKCNLCSNVYYSYLLCEVIVLFAEYYRLAKNLKDAGDYFKGNVFPVSLNINRTCMRKEGSLLVLVFITQQF